MDFSCTKNDLVAGVKLASYALGARTSLPILSGMKMELSEKRLRLQATDLERAVRCEIPIEAKHKDESVVLNGTVLTQIAAHLPEDERVTLKTDSTNGSVVKVRCGEASFDLPTLPVEDYPQIPDLPGERTATLKLHSFHRAFEQTAFACLKAGETTRLSLTGVDFVLTGKALKLIATNGYRLSVKTVDAQEVRAETEFLIEAGVLADLDRVLTQVGAEEVHLHKGDGQVFFHAGNVTFMAKTIAEEFPDFERVIPKDNPIGLLFDRRALLDALQRIQITAAEESGAVTIRVTPDESAARVNSSSREKGEAEERVRLKKVPGKGIAISFRAEHLIDAVKRMSSEEIAFWLAAPEKAGLLEPYGERISAEDAGFLYVCMPVQLRT